jgi:hypothetical protein
MKVCSSGLIVLLALFGASVCFAQQAESSGSTAPSTTKPAPADGTSTSTPASTPASTPTATPPEKKKPKKVWTNEEIGSVGGTISVVGDEKASSDGGRKTADSAATGSGDDVKQHQIENYRGQIQEMRAQMDAIDKRIAQLKDFKAENTDSSGGININHGYNMVPLEDQVKQLEEKKKQLAAKIDDVEVEAKKNGIEPGDLR